MNVFDKEKFNIEMNLVIERFSIEKLLNIKLTRKHFVLIPITEKKGEKQ